MAEDTFSNKPEVAVVEMITEWRWPIFFPLGPAMSRQYAEPIRIVRIPNDLAGYPKMRGVLPGMGSREVDPGDEEFETLGAITTDLSLPILRIVNEARLIEMIEDNSRPEHVI